MVRLTWGKSLGLQPIPQLWSDLHAFLQRTPADVHLDEINDDLVGCFNSVPRQQILLSLRALVDQFLDQGYPNKKSSRDKTFQASQDDPGSTFRTPLHSFLLMLVCFKLLARFFANTEAPVVAIKLAQCSVACQ